MYRDSYFATWREKRKLKKIAKRLTIQSHAHALNIEDYFRIIIKESRARFMEDNDITLHYFLRERFDNAIKKELKFPADKLLIT